MKTTHKKTGKNKNLLPKSFKKKWLKALRSGEFKQTVGSLEDVLASGETGYCCLGVACRIVHPRIGIMNYGFISKDNFGRRLSSIKVPAILKGSSERGEKDYNAIVDTLSAMNDKGKTFIEIADYIEKNL